MKALFGTLFLTIGIVALSLAAQEDVVTGMNDSTSGKSSDSLERAIFAGGCFWGVEYHFMNTPGVVSTRVGYTGGHKEHPTYAEVCSGTTGHIEAIEITFDPSKTTYEEMAKLFFEIHDPTQVNRQGPDVGEQYQSVVFYLDEHQKEITEKLIGILKQKGYNVATKLRQATAFWEAEDYHQEYYDKNGRQPYCHAYVKRF